ncbi:hypothetical protein B0H17DRAFT_1204600 [Mycena rosella]|uniref:Uncharacterized protein n=1 Tax=Mycena rosella TaxID=1033263 RepID=A0AAD7D951_MYCRO|nr:hypothetical protein B0H17DRAFT_1204600 [Mycena rosella]
MKGGVEETYTLTIMHATQEVGTKHPVNSSILVTYLPDCHSGGRTGHFGKIPICATPCGGHHVLVLACGRTVYAWGNDTSWKFVRRILERRKGNSLKREVLPLYNIVAIFVDTHKLFAVNRASAVLA